MPSLEGMTRIQGGSSPQLNTSQQATSSHQSAEVPQVGQQVQQTLFGRAKPPILDPAQFPQLAAQLRLLNRYKKKLATMAGDDEGDYEVVLTEGTIAMIDAEGQVYVGAGFLQAFADAETNSAAESVLVGVLGHEIGHRPKRWNKYRSKRRLSRDELQQLCRFEETRADIFAGKALAEMGLSADPLCEFLLAITSGDPNASHPEYFPVNVRVEVIQEAFSGRTYRRKARRSLFPGFDRMSSPKGHLGEY